MHGDTASLKSTELNGNTELLHTFKYTGDVSLHTISEPYESCIIP
jgi:hypothetical protein